jgi:hypothetical protein
VDSLMLAYRMEMNALQTRNLEAMAWLLILNVTCLVFMITPSSVVVDSET